MAQDKEKNKKGQWAFFGKIVGLNIVIVAALVVLLITCVAWWLDSYTHHSERVDVPSLQGIPVEDAQRFLEDKGLRGLVIDSVYAKARPGSVIEQMPAAGLPVKKGRIVYLTINAYGVRMIKMPHVLEGGSRQALTNLRATGFVVDSVRLVADDHDDLVLGVTCGGVDAEPGQEYPDGTHVVVAVGSTHIVLKPENEEQEDAWNE